MAEQSLMPRKSSVVRTTKQQKLHEASLERRRARRAEHQAEMAMALNATREAPGRSDLDKAAGISPRHKNTPGPMVKARDNLAYAFELMGGVPEFVKWGKLNPTEFYRIWARLVPKEVVNETDNLPLESLLAQLAERADQTVAQAATEIGQSVLEEAGRRVAAEDADAMFASGGTSKH